MTALPSYAGIRRTRPGREREFVTPEGIDLRLVLADASERASAFLLDVFFIVLSLIAMTIVFLIASAVSGHSLREYMIALWLLGFFLVRVFYFTAFELTPRAATPAKRLLGIRVARRDGGPLTADAIFARNALRELEVFLPLTFVAVRAQAVDGWISILALVWCGVFTLFPLFNADRLRVGDLVAGTWVVHAPKRSLGAELTATADAKISFLPHALEAYGIHELSVLENVLRQRHPETMHAVAARIRTKIGMPADGIPDSEFLAAYYTALRKRLESRLLLGRRKRDKFDKG